MEEAWKLTEKQRKEGWGYVDEGRERKRQRGWVGGLREGEKDRETREKREGLFFFIYIQHHIL